jgi:hypothetical protein
MSDREQIARHLNDGSFVVDEAAYIDTGNFAAFLAEMLALAIEIPAASIGVAVITTAEDYYDGYRVGWRRPATSLEIEAFNRAVSAEEQARAAQVAEALEQAVKDWRPFAEAGS